MRRNTKAGDVDADDPHSIDFIGKQPQRHTRRGGHAQVGHDHSVIPFRISHFVYCIPDILEQFTRHEGLGIEGHISDRTARPVKVADKCQSIDATGRPGQNRGRAAHPQTHAQRTERGAHGLGFIVGALGIVFCVLIQNVGFARHTGSRFHFTGARVTSHTINGCSTHRCLIPVLAECDLYFGRVIIADLRAARVMLVHRAPLL